jgi:hypothetical protein
MKPIQLPLEAINHHAPQHHDGDQAACFMSAANSKLRRIIKRLFDGSMAADNPRLARRPPPRGCRGDEGHCHRGRAATPVRRRVRERQAAFVRQCDSRAVVRWLDDGGQPTFGSHANMMIFQLPLQANNHYATQSSSGMGTVGSRTEGEVALCKKLQKHNANSCKSL